MLNATEIMELQKLAGMENFKKLTIPQYLAREKLIRLISSTEYGNGSLMGKNFQKGFIEKIADHLIANGVTLANQVASNSKQVASSEWIPVTERLPESQNPVLVVAVSKGMGLPYIFKAAHINHHEITEDEYGWTDGEYDSEYDEENDCFWIPECWYECNAVEGNTNWVMDEDYTITHWMPLPEPPKGE